MGMQKLEQVMSFWLYLRGPCIYIWLDLQLKYVIRCSYFLSCSCIWCSNVQLLFCFSEHMPACLLVLVVSLDTSVSVSSVFDWHTHTHIVSFLFFFLSLDDLTGKVLAYISLLPIAILVGFVTLIVFKRELHTVSLSLWESSLERERERVSAGGKISPVS